MCKPFCAHGNCIAAGDDVDRYVGKLQIADGPLASVDCRHQRQRPLFRLFLHGLAQAPLWSKPGVAIKVGESRQQEAVLPDQGKVASGFSTDPGIKTLEIFGQYRRLNDPAEAFVRRGAAVTDAEERGAAIGRPWPEHLPHIGADLARHVRFEIVAVRKINRG